MLPLYAARIEDLGRGDFLKVDCAACHHVALFTPDALLRVGLSPAAKVLDLKGRLRCRGCGRKGRAVVSIKWRGAVAWFRHDRRITGRRPQHSGKERRRVGGNSRRRSPRRAWPRAGPVTPSPLRSYAPAVKEMSPADDAPVLSRSPLRVSADRLVRFGDGLSRTRREARCTGPFMPALRRGMKGGVLCFPIGRCEGTLGSAPF